MKRLILIPDGWPVTFNECPPGPFLYQKRVYFMSEYFTDNRRDAYNEAGEYLSLRHEAALGKKIMVQPLLPKWDEA